jgi:hypothetical protein
MAGSLPRPRSRVPDSSKKPFHPERIPGSSPGGGDFGGYLASREDEVAEALLAITDSRRRAPVAPRS